MGDLTKSPAGTGKPPPNALALQAYRGNVDPAGVTVQAIDAALVEQAARLTPAVKRDNRFRSSDPAEVGRAIGDNPDTRDAIEYLKMIGRKIRPDFSASQAQHWAGAVIAGLSDFPGPVIAAACRAARHHAFEFPGQVDGAIRKAADDIMRRHNVAKMRLESLRRQIMRSAQPRLPAPPPRPLTQQEVDEMPAEMRALGLKIGALVEDADGRVMPNPEPPEE